MDNFSLSEYVKSFDGMLVFADVHGDYESFKRAYDFATSKNYFFMSLGDLVDRGRQPFEVIRDMHAITDLGRGAVTIGNHDDKHYRGMKGNKVHYSWDARQTIADVGAERKADFERMYLDILEDRVLASMVHRFGDIVLVHAASHPSLWEGPKEGPVGKSAKSRFLVGETNGEVYEDGYPVRLYNWIEEVPESKTLIVGHDKQPIHNVPIVEPMVVTNKHGGTVVFLDTGCAKGGYLSGAVILHDKSGFRLDRFVEFR